MKKENLFLFLGVILLSFSVGLVFFVLLTWSPLAANTTIYVNASNAVQTFYLMLLSFLSGSVGGFLVGLHSQIVRSVGDPN